MSEPAAHRRHLPRLRWLLIGGLALVVVAWAASAISGAIANIEFDGLEYPYAVIFGFVVFDAVIPIFPSESWAAFTCISSALVATVIADQPILSMLVSIVLTTALLAVLYRSLKKGWEEPVDTSGTATA